MTLISLILFVGIFSSIYDFIHSFFKKASFGERLAHTFALHIILLTMLFNFLSPFKALTQTTCLVFFFLFPLVNYIIVIKNDRFSLFYDFKKWIDEVQKNNSELILLLPILIFISFSAFYYSPTTWDSMTYHMTKVVHWMNNKSIGYFYTNNSRQTILGPGAEYIILSLQVIAQTDYLANFPQFLSYLILIPCSLELSKILGIPNSISGWVTIITLSAPMLIAQGSTTQNDLVSSVVAYSMIFYLNRLLNEEKLNSMFMISFLFGLSFGVGMLVKPTGNLVVVFSSIVVGWITIKKFWKQHKFILVPISLIFGTLIPTVFDVIRKFLSTGNLLGARAEIYPIFGEFTFERIFLSPLQGFAKNLPYDSKIFFLYSKIVDKLNAFGISAQPIGGQYFGAYATNEDWAGNVFQSILIVISGICLLGLITKKILNKDYSYFKTLNFIFALSISFVVIWLFGFMIRMQPWITRLQCPFFVILPVYYFFIKEFMNSNVQLVHRFIKFFAILGLAFGTLTAINNQRTIVPGLFFGQQISDRAYHYYRSNNSRVDIDDEILSLLQSSNCKHYGYFTHGDSYEYPHIWKAYQKGIKGEPIKQPGENSGLCLWNTDSEEATVSLKKLTNPKWISASTKYPDLIFKPLTE